MSLIIKGAEMPGSCAGCPCADDGARYCRAANEYIPMLGVPAFCPLIEIATPHGPLVDITEVIDTETLYPVSFRGLEYTEILEAEG